MKYENIFAFNGINRRVSPFLPEIGDLWEAQNVTTPKIGSLSKSFDYSMKGSQITGGYSVLGGVDFFRNDGTHEHIVVVDGPTNAKVYKYDAGWSTQSPSLTSGTKTRFAYSNTIDTLFMVNIEDATQSYDGSTWSSSTNVTSAPKGKFAFSFGDRIYILNADVSGTAYPTRAYRSSLIETSATWDTDNDWFEFNDVITGVSRNGENMLVLCENSTHILTLADEKYQVSDIGCVSHEGVVTRGRYTFYPSRQGYMIFDGAETTVVSDPISDYWNLLSETNLSNISAARKGENLYIYTGDVTDPDDSTSTLQNTIWDYSIAQNNWNRGRLSHDIKHIHTYVTDTGTQIFMGDDNGNVFQLLSGDGLQNGANYSAHIETHWLFGSGANVLDDWYQLWAYGNKLSGMLVQYKTTEDGDWQSAGELRGEIAQTKLGTGKGVRAYKIKFRLSEFSGQTSLGLDGIDVGFNPAYLPREPRRK